jgi:hypothetical protein
MTQIAITQETANDVIKELEDAFYDIPFENSKFQTEAFVIASNITPERAYRSIGLRMMAKLRALNEAKFGKMKQQVDLDEIDHKLADPNLDQFERRRQEIKKQEMLSGNYWSDKLINDAIQELNVLYAHFKTLPKYTRDQFEQAEQLHFEQRLNRQVLGVQGAHESLVNMRDDLKALQNYEQQVEQLGLTPNETMQLEDLRNSMTNIMREQVPASTPTNN